VVRAVWVPICDCARGTGDGVGVQPCVFLFPTAEIMRQRLVARTHVSFRLADWLRGEYRGTHDFAVTCFDWVRRLPEVSGGIFWCRGETMFVLRACLTSCLACVGRFLDVHV